MIFIKRLYTGFNVNDEPLYTEDYITLDFGRDGSYVVICKNKQFYLRDYLFYQEPFNLEITPDILINGSLYLPYLKTGYLDLLTHYGNIYCDHCGKLAGKYLFNDNFIDYRTLQFNQFGYETIAEIEGNQILSLKVACPRCIHQKTYLHQNKSAIFFLQLLCQKYGIVPLYEITNTSFKEAEEFVLSVLKWEKQDYFSV